MDQPFRLLCRGEVRKLILLMGATVVLLTVLQRFEFPSNGIFRSVYSAVNNSSFFSVESPLLENGLNSSNANSFHETKITSEVADANGQFVGGTESKGEKSLHDNNVSGSQEGSSNSSGLLSAGTVLLDQMQHNKTTVNNTLTVNAMAPGIYNLSSPGDVYSVSEENGHLNLNRTFPSTASPSLPALSNKTLLPDTEVRGSMDFVDLNASSVRNGAAESGGNSGLQLSNFSVSDSGSSSSGLPALKKKTSKKPPSKVISIAQMNVLLQQSRFSPNSSKPSSHSDADKEMLFAKTEIQNAPDIVNDTRLYAPIYRNVSMFKRSYELMESMLKVFIYQDGEKPIFHQPILEGIYASEGWFMKHMEEHEKFVTKDPKKAHLFYFPFSSRLLELTLYVRHSHSRNNLIEYMKNYVDLIAAKYSFWNRTGGADHFLAACHDWAPAETRGRILNSIRALCNADIDVGFSIGKDVSLPETYVHSAKNPVKYLGGNPSSQRPVLAFFAGNLHGYVRPILLEYWGNKDPDMKIFGPMPHVKGKTDYFQLMKSSKYCICPKGHEVNSPRIVESIFYECVPVIISDNYVPPFFEVLDWESFAVFVLEKDIPNLKNILLSISQERYVELHKRVKKVQEHFLWHTKPVRYDLFHMILHSVWFNRIFQIQPA